MTFDRTRFSRSTSAGNTGEETVSGALTNGPAIFTYSSADDDVATISAANYFTTAAFELSKNDILFVNGSDAFASLRVDAIDRTANPPTISVEALSLANLPDSNVTNAKLGEDTVHSVTVEVTSAELLALASAPKTIVAAPGAGKVIQFFGALLQKEAGTAYVEGTYNAAFRYTDGSGVIVSEDIETTGYLDQTGVMYTNSIPKKDVIVTTAGAANQALVLDNIGADEWTTGTGSVFVTLSYKVVTAS